MVSVERVDEYCHIDQEVSIYTIILYGYVLPLNQVVSTHTTWTCATPRLGGEYLHYIDIYCPLDKQGCIYTT